MPRKASAPSSKSATRNGKIAEQYLLRPQINESRHLSRQLYSRHPQHRENDRHGRRLGEGKSAELLRVQISFGTRLSHDPGQSRARWRDNARTENLRAAERHS